MAEMRTATSLAGQVHHLTIRLEAPALAPASGPALPSAATTVLSLTSAPLNALRVVQRCAKHELSCSPPTALAGNFSGRKRPFPFFAPDGRQGAPQGAE